MKILFVCSGNAFRSPVAEALLKKSRSDIEVDSAGTHPAIPISGAYMEYLAKENAKQYLKKSPESLDDKQLNDYDLIIAMESRHKDAILNRCLDCKSKIIVWNIEDPYFLPHDEAKRIFHQIKNKVEELANSL